MAEVSTHVLVAIMRRAADHHDAAHRAAETAASAHKVANPEAVTPAGKPQDQAAPGGR